MKGTLKKLCLFFVLLVVSGCAYSFSTSTLPSHLKSIQIHPLENQTYQSLLGDNLFTSLKTTFRKEAPALRQVNQTAHSELIVKLLNYSNTPSNYNSTGEVSHYQSKLTVSVLFRDVVKDVVLYKNESLSAVANYDISNGETEKRNGQPNVIKELQDLLTRNVLSKW